MARRYSRSIEDVIADAAKDFGRAVLTTVTNWWSGSNTAEETDAGLTAADLPRWYTHPEGHQECIVQVDSSRWATLMKESLDSSDLGINAWSPKDVVCALKHLTLQQVTALHDIVLDFTHDENDHPHGPCPDSEWEEEQWSPVLEELLGRQHLVGSIMVVTPDDTLVPLDGLLQAIRHVIKQGHSLTQGIEVKGGKVSETELRTTYDWAVCVDLKSLLCDVTVVLSPEHGIEDVSEVSRDLMRRSADSLLYKTFVTADGLHETDDRGYELFEMQSSDSARTASVAAAIGGCEFTAEGGRTPPSSQLTGAASADRVVGCVDKPQKVHIRRTTRRMMDHDLPSTSFQPPPYADPLADEAQGAMGISRNWRFESHYTHHIQQGYPSPNTGHTNTAGMQEDMVPVHPARWAIVPSNLGIRFKVWCPEDVITALDAYEQDPPLHHITVDFRHSEHWGPCPDGMWTREQWRPVLEELLKPQHQVRELSIIMPDDTPVRLDGLLQAQRDVIKRGHSLAGGVTLWNGKVSESELKETLDWTTYVGLTLQLYVMTVILREDRSIQDVRGVYCSTLWIRTRIKKFVTADGQHEYDMVKDPLGLKKSRIGWASSPPNLSHYEWTVEESIYKERTNARAQTGLTSTFGQLAMAETSEPPMIWMETHPGEQQVVRKSRQHRTLIYKHWVDLTDNVTMQELWGHLRHLNVIDASMNTVFRSLGTNKACVEGLLDMLLNSPRWKLHAFIRALCLSGQQHVVNDILNMDVLTYVPEQGHLVQDSNQTLHLPDVAHSIPNQPTAQGQPAQSASPPHGQQHHKLHRQQHQGQPKQQQQQNNRQQQYPQQQHDQQAQDSEYHDAQQQDCQQQQDYQQQDNKQQHNQQQQHHKPGEPILGNQQLTFSGHFSTDGGELRHPSSDVFLKVPVGAVPPGECWTLCIKVHTDLMNYNKWIEPTEFIMAPVVECTVDSNKQFKKPVTIAIPLCETMGNPSDVTVLYSTEGGHFHDAHECVYIDYVIRDRLLHLNTYHFTKFLVKAWKTKNITEVLITLRAAMKPSILGNRVELRLMTHVNCHSLKDFYLVRQRYDPPGMEEIDRWKVCLPKTKKQLTFPKIIIRLEISNESLDAWDIRKHGKKAAKEVDGRSVLNIVNDSEFVGDFTLESKLKLEQVSFAMAVTFKYEKAIYDTTKEFVETYGRNMDFKSRTNSVVDSICSADADATNNNQQHTVPTGVGRQVAVLANSIREELQSRKDELVGGSGLGVYAVDTRFLARIVALQILQDVSTQQIKAAKTRSEAAAALVEQLLPCKPTKLVVFGWLLVDEDKEHHLPTSVTPDVRTWLRGYTKTQIMQLVKDME